MADRWRTGYRLRYGGGAADTALDGLTRIANSSRLSWRVPPAGALVSYMISQVGEAGHSRAPVPEPRDLPKGGNKDANSS